MDGVHLCHDVQIGNHCVLGIKTTVAGECQIDDCTILSSNVILHQYCHIGSWVLIQAGCRISKDVPPYISVQDALQKIEDQVPMSDEIHNIINFIKNSKGIVK